jgi:hypothetical protein
MTYDKTVVTFFSKSFISISCSTDFNQRMG